MEVFHIIDGFESQIAVRRILPGMYEIVGESISNERAPEICYAIVPGKDAVLRDSYSGLFHKSRGTMSISARSCGVDFRGRMIYGRNIIDIQYAILNLRIVGIGKVLAS